MQEKQTVSFQPIGYEGHVPWFVNLFVVYLLYVLLTTVGSAVRVMWSLRKIRKASEREPCIELVVCSAKIRSIRNFCHLTFLLATLVLSSNTIDILSGVSTAKAPSFTFVAAELAQALVPFAMGILLFRSVLLWHVS